jgi:hypothetical protein
VLRRPPGRPCVTVHTLVGGRGTVGDRVLSRRRVLMLAFVVSGLLLGLVPLLLR